MPTSPVHVYVECVNPSLARINFLAAIGIDTLFGRWEMLPARISPLNPCSIDIAIPDFRESDIELLRNQRGVVKVGRITADITLPSPIKARRDFFHPTAA